MTQRAASEKQYAVEKTRRESAHYLNFCERADTLVPAHSVANVVMEYATVLS